MNNLSDMIWIEQRKAIRSGMPLWTALGSLFMPLGIGFLIFYEVVFTGDGQKLQVFNSAD